MSAELKKVQGALGDVEGQAAKSGTTLEGLGKTISGLTMGVAVAGVAAFGGALVASVKSAADFEHGISGIAAVSGATADELEGIRQTALKLGADTSFSATEAATGMEELVKAGISLADVMGGAGRASLDLAAAGEVSVAEAATIASNAMNAFGLTGADMTHVADTIAGAANASAIDVHEFGFSLSSAGAVAATVGFSFDDLAQAIAVMGQAGIKGSDAGTSLKTMMLNLQPQTNKQIDLFRDLGITSYNVEKGMAAMTKLGLDPALAAMEDGEETLKKAVTGWDGMKKMTKDQEEAWAKAQNQLGLLDNAFFDSTGKVKSMADVSQVLQDALAGMTEQQKLATLETIFGSDAIRAGAVLAKAGAQGFNDMADAMGKVSAQDVANERLNNLQGSLEKLKGSLETAAIGIGSAFLPALKDMTDAATTAVNDAMPQMTEAANNMAAAFVAALPSITAFFKLMVDNGDTIKTVAVALAALGIIVTVTGWITGAIAAFSALSATVAASGSILVGIVAILGGPVTLIVAAVVALVVGLGLAWATNFLGIRDITSAVVTAIIGFFTNLAANLQLISDAMVVWLNTTSVGITTWLTTVSTFWITTWTTIQTFMQTFFDLVGQIILVGLGIWYTLFVEPFVNIATLFIDTFTAIATWLDTNFWQPVSALFTAALANLQNGILTPAWTTITSTTQAAWTAIATWLESNFWAPVTALTTAATQAITRILADAWAAISNQAQGAWNSINGMLAGQWNTMQQGAAKAAGPLPGFFDQAWNAIKSGISGTLSGAVKEAVSLFNSMVSAGKKVVDTINEIIKVVGKLSSMAIPSILKRSSPPEMAQALDEIAAAADSAIGPLNAFGRAASGLPSGAATAMSGARRYFSSVGQPSTDNIAEYIAQAAALRGIDPTVALTVANSEGGVTEPARRGTFATGSSWWPFQLHYGGNGYEYLGNVAGMGNSFTAMTGWAPGDPNAWKDSVDYALDVAAKSGWGQWYGAAAAGIGNFQGISRKYGGMIPGALGQPQLAMVHGGEMVLTPAQQAALLHGSAGGGGLELHVHVNAPIYGVNDMETVVINALDRATRRGRH